MAHSETKIVTQHQSAIVSKERLHKLIIEKQRSLSLFHPKLLAELFVKGYGSFVIKILLRLKALLET